MQERVLGQQKTPTRPQTTLGGVQIKFRYYRYRKYIYNLHTCNQGLEIDLQGHSSSNVTVPFECGMYISTLAHATRHCIIQLK